MITVTHPRLTWHAFLGLFLIAMHMLLFGNLFIGGTGVGTPALLPLAFVTAAYTAACLARMLDGSMPRVSTLDLAVSLYLLYSAASVVLFLQDGNPASPGAYLYGLNVHVLPMTLYFAARGVNRLQLTRLLRLVVLLQAFAAVVGILLFFTQPDFYTDYLRNRLGRTEDWQLYARLQSYLGSTSMGILCATCLVLVLNIEVSRVQRYALALLFVLTVFLTQQRGAYASALLGALFLVYRLRIRPLELLLGAGILGVAIFSIFRYLELPTDFFAGIVDNRLVRDLLEGDPMGERAVSWRKGLGFLGEFPFGLGVGATTSAAHEAGAHLDGQVVDAYYMRIAADLGALGLMLFVSVLAVAAWSGLRNQSVVGFWVIVIMFAFQLVGTNVLDSYYVSHVFWLLLGWIGATSVRGAEVRLGVGAPAGRAEPSAKTTGASA